MPERIFYEHVEQHAVLAAATCRRTNQSVAARIIHRPTDTVFCPPAERRNELSAVAYKNVNTLVARRNNVDTRAQIGETDHSAVTERHGIVAAENDVFRTTRRHRFWGIRITVPPQHAVRRHTRKLSVARDARAVCGVLESAVRHNPVENASYFRIAVTVRRRDIGTFDGERRYIEHTAAATAEKHVTADIHGATLCFTDYLRTHHNAFAPRCAIDRGYSRDTAIAVERHCEFRRQFQIVRKQPVHCATTDSHPAELAKLVPSAAARKRYFEIAAAGREPASIIAHERKAAFYHLTRILRLVAEIRYLAVRRSDDGARLVLPSRKFTAKSPPRRRKFNAAALRCVQKHRQSKPAVKQYGGDRNDSRESRGYKHARKHRKYRSQNDGCEIE